MQINLPESKTATSAPAEIEPVILSISENDEITLDGKAVALEDLESAVRNLPETRRTSLALKADKKVSYEILIKVMDALKLAGVKKLPALTHGQ